MSQDRPNRVSTLATGLGSNSDTLRQSNLSAVLSLVHSSGGISRAQLTRALGLNRSTVALLVAELVGLGLVIESEPDQTNRIGRPSAVVEPSRTTVALAVNPDLDVIRVSVVSLGGHVLDTVSYDTVRVPSAREVVNVVTVVFDSMRRHFADGYRVVGAGVAVPGLVRASDGLVIDAPHLGWRDEPLCAMLAEALDVPVFAANDAVVGASAQALFGAGRDIRDFVYLYGGASGIGGGIVSGDTLVRGAAGFAGQLGHVHVHSGGVACDCGSTGCLEAEVTRRELMDVVGLDAASADGLHEAVLARLASEGDDSPVAAVVRRQVDLLAVGLTSITSLLNPTRILLDGFLRILLEAAPERLAAAVHHATIRGPRDDVQIGLASLDDEPLLVGAAQLAFARLIADPASVAAPAVSAPILPSTPSADALARRP